MVHCYPISLYLFARILFIPLFVSFGTGIILLNENYDFCKMPLNGPPWLVQIPNTQ